jgi:phytoene dehydrogenase-like protein
VTDAVVIGAGPNGLVAANLLADAGWRVVCLEANDSPGGAVRSAEVTAPGFVSDLFSAFYPLAFDSPALQPLRLHDHGLRWSHAPVVLAHPAADDGACAVLSRDLDETAASLDRFRPGDGDAWRRLYGMWSELGGDFVGAMFGPFRPRGRRCGWPGRSGSPAASGSPASRCSRCGGSPRRSSAVRAAVCCSPATRCTPTSRRRPRAAARSAGCCRCSASRSASRCP